MPKEKLEEKQREKQEEKPKLQEKKNRLTLFVLIGLLVVGTALSWGWLVSLAGTFALETSSVSETVSAPVLPVQAATEPAARFLDGLPLTDERQPYPMGMMIENLPEVRPQSGLSNAAVVYEALAEGGATRFLALFNGPGSHLAKIGPIRSARPYYLEWSSEYNAAYGHAGGSPDALQMIDGFGIMALNGIGREAKYFWRDRGIGAPHNLFTSSELLSRAARDLALEEKTPSFLSWHFKDEKGVAERPSGEPYVTIKFSGYAFETEYRYRQATNDFARFNSGLPHEDALTGEQIRAKNVVVQIIPKILDVGEKGRLTLDVHGTGKALIFVDGGMNVGTWSKKDRTSRTEFFFEDGRPAELNRGSTWIAVVPEDKAVEYGSR